MVEIEVTLSPKDLYDFNLKHSYSSVSGILATAVGLVGVIYGFYAKYWILLIVGAILVVYTPIVLLLRAHQTYSLTPAMKKPLKYTFDEKGITISQEENSQTYEWKDIVKAVSTGRSIIVYTTKYNATIVPKAQAGEALPLVIAAISAGLDPKKNKIRS
ncbi:MAG: YcxB family protein [Lachnospiraceae bacterium]|nr:YcxB family protein [Lachnospiraceae bacterium]